VCEPDDALFTLGDEQDGLRFDQFRFDLLGRIPVTNAVFDRFLGEEGVIRLPGSRRDLIDCRYIVRSC
jgi:hypothetical protein